MGDKCGALVESGGVLSGSFLVLVIYWDQEYR